MKYLSLHRDRRFEGTQDEFSERLRLSTTVYVGNLSFYTTEDQIYEVRIDECSPMRRDRQKLLLFVSPLPTVPPRSPLDAGI